MDGKHVSTSDQCTQKGDLEEECQADNVFPEVNQPTNLPVSADNVTRPDNIVLNEADRENRGITGREHHGTLNQSEG